LGDTWRLDFIISNLLNVVLFVLIIIDKLPSSNEPMIIKDSFLMVIFMIFALIFWIGITTWLKKFIDKKKSAREDIIKGIKKKLKKIEPMSPN